MQILKKLGLFFRKACEFQVRSSGGVSIYVPLRNLKVDAQQGKILEKIAP